MANRQKRVFSIILCIAMFFSIGIVGLAGEPSNWVQLKDVPAGVIKAQICIAGEYVDCDTTHWRTPDEKTYVTTDIIGIRLFWSPTEYTDLDIVDKGATYGGSDQYYAKLGNESGGTLNIWITANTNYVAPTYGVSYSYVATDGTLPAGISTTSGTYAISDTTTYTAGVSVYLINTAPAVGTEYQVTDGKWTLASWSTNPISMTSAGVSFIGTWTFTPATSITVTKTPLTTSITAPGGSVTYRVDIYNPSRTESTANTVTINTLTDAIDGGTASSIQDAIFDNADLTGTTTFPFDIAPGVTKTFYFSGSVSGSAGTTVSDIVTASGYDIEENPVSASDEASVTIIPTTPSYTYTIVHNYYSTDGETQTLVGSISIPMTFEEGTEITAGSIAQVPNYGGVLYTFTGMDMATDYVILDGNTLTLSYLVSHTTQPSITVTKTPLTSSVTAPGGSVIYRVEISYSGITESSVMITDLTDAIGGGTAFSLEGNIFDNPGLTGIAVEIPFSIASGETKTLYFSGLVSGSAGTTVSDVVTASGYDRQEMSVSAFGTATVAITTPGTPTPPPPSSPTPPTPTPEPTGILGEQDIEEPAPAPEPSPAPAPEDAPAVAGDSDKLPQTGGISFSTLFGFAGIALIFGGMIVILTKKRKEQ